jgi:transcriptional regulator with XRE-family HTH domain
MSIFFNNSEEKYNQEIKLAVSILKSLRIKANLTQMDVASKLDKPQSFVSKYEIGERRLDIIELKLVCEALGISLSDYVNILERKTEIESEQKIP